MGGLAPGQILSDTYRIVRRIGQGGMGEVYEATHLRLSGRYAIKVLLVDAAGRPDIFARFRREAEVTSAIRHPHIVSMVDFNQTPSGHPYIAMEFLAGRELSEELAQVGPLPLARVVDIVGQVAGALGAAHARGIVHRDLKPQNLFLVEYEGQTGDLVKLLDFGISKVHEATTQLTQQQVLMGTPHYMSPEQALGQSTSIDHLTDQFALATVAYELLTGVRAFAGDNPVVVLYQVVHQTPAPLRSFVPTVPAAVEAVLARAMAKDRGQRYPSVVEFHRALLAASRESVASAAAMPRLGVGQTRRLPASPTVASAVPTDTTLGGSAADLSAVKPSGAGRGVKVMVSLLGAAVIGGLAHLYVNRAEPPVASVAAPERTAPPTAAPPAPATPPPARAAAPRPEAAAAPPSLRQDAAPARTDDNPPLTDPASARAEVEPPTRGDDGARATPPAKGAASVPRGTTSRKKSARAEAAAAKTGAPAAPPPAATPAAAPAAAEPAQGDQPPAKPPGPRDPDEPFDGLRKREPSRSTAPNDP